MKFKVGHAREEDLKPIEETKTEIQNRLKELIKNVSNGRTKGSRFC